MPEGATTTILFTDLVTSTELLQRAGDEDAQRVFQAHHRLLSEAVRAHGGHEVKWLGDGLMVAFPSAADGVRCAIAMQQAARRAPERLGVRIGLNAGDALRSETDYFGTAVVVARRLCDSADAGQIRCSAVVAALLAGRQAFAFRDLGPLELKGIAQPVTACEVVYERDDAAAMLVHTPFVGRSAELARLEQRLVDARGGHGGLVMLVGEPGIGKTRLADEFAERAAANGARVLRGRCFEGEWTPPYAPFVEALEGYAGDTAVEELRADMGAGAGPVARIAPGLRERLPDIAEPAPLAPDEERFRLLDAVAQFLIATSGRAPSVLMLDDLHWADRGTIAMLRHCSRFARQHPLLVVGAYRDVELDRQHPLADALAALRREAEYERIVLRGLRREDVGALLSTIAEQEAHPALVQAISDETDGNPFFIREVLAHLVEEGKLYRDEQGVWTSKARSIADLGIPEGVRQVITRRLSRLSDAANRLLTAASAFNGGFQFQAVAAAAEIDEAAALDAVDETLSAQVLRSGDAPDAYDFPHALIRHTLYGEMNPSRQVRLHRRIAEAMEGLGGASPGELAYQYHRSAALPGAERGVAHAVAAADAAEAAAAWDEAASFLQMAVDLVSEADPRRPRLIGRRAIAEARALRYEEAEHSALSAAEAIAAADGNDAAADYLSEASGALTNSGYTPGGWRLAARGLELIDPARRDMVWAQLAASDLVRREAEDPENPGIPLPNRLRDEIGGVIRSSADPAARGMLRGGTLTYLGFESRTHAIDALRTEERWDATHPEIAATGSLVFARALWNAFWIGDLRAARAAWEEIARLNDQTGAVAGAAASWATVCRVQLALGEIAEAGAALARAHSYADRLVESSAYTLQIVAADDERWAVLGEWTSSQPAVTAIDAQQVMANRWAAAAIFAGLARSFSRLGRHDDALALLAQAIQPIERAPGGAANFARMACTAAETLWVTQRTDYMDVIERALREKVLAPDFRYVNVDARLELARLCAISGRIDEARRWFAEARRVLEEQGARPLRAICDHDEALTLIRNGGDRAEAAALLDAAIARFREIGMTGWLRDAGALRATL